MSSLSINNFIKYAFYLVDFSNGYFVNLNEAKTKIKYSKYYSVSWLDSI